MCFNMCFPFCRSLVVAAALAGPAFPQALPGGPKYRFPIRYHALEGSNFATQNVAVDDWTLDGINDVLATTGVDWRLNVADGNGDFLPGVLIGQEWPVGDLNGDGRIDLAKLVANGASSALLKIRYSAGPGTFQFAQTSVPNVSIDNSQLHVADMDVDGVADLFGGGLKHKGILTFFGSGSGSISKIVSSPLSQGLFSEGSGDFDGDGIPDYLVQEQFYKFYFIRGLGHRTFAPALLLGTFNASHEMLVSDFDVDGDLDAVLAHETSDDPGYLTGTGTSAPVYAGTLTGPLQSASGGTIGMADHDQDGITDVYQAFGSQFVSGDFGWYRGQAGSPPTTFVSFGFRLGSSKVMRGDLDTDGVVDWISPVHAGVVAIEEHGSGLAIGSQTGSPYPNTPLSSAVQSIPVDLDGDAKVELATVGAKGSGQATTELKVWKVGADATFTEVDAQPYPNSALDDLVRADFNSDGRVDLALSTAYSGSTLPSVHTLVGGPSATVAPYSAVAVGAFKCWLQVADLDSDGHADVLASSRDIPPNQSSGLHVLRGDGTGALIPAWQQGLAAQTQLFLPHRSALADIDLDGWPDAVTRAGEQDRVAVWRSHGDGTFGLATTGTAVPGGSVLTAFDVLDLDEDGDFDVLAGAGSSLYGCFTQGSASLSAPSLLAMQVSGGTILDLVTRDLDRDGRREWIVEDESTIPTEIGPRWTVYERKAGAWTRDGQHALLGSLRAASFADLDHDGALDAFGVAGGRRWRGFGGPALPAGLGMYGTGTSDCLGAVTAVASGEPVIGNTQFRLSWGGAPNSAAGIVGLGVSADLQGTPFLGVGPLAHLDLSAPLWILGTQTDSTGAAGMSLPIPADLALVGFQLFSQAVFVVPAWQSCSPSPLPWSSSTGLQVTVLP
jgi:FG-GAP-like repeat